MSSKLWYQRWRYPGRGDLKELGVRATKNTKKEDTEMQYEATHRQQQRWRPAEESRMKESVRRTNIEDRS